MWLFVCCGCNINRFLTVFELGMLLLMGNQGGGVIHDVAGDQLYHLYVSRMTNNCSLRHWTKNSRIDHAVSKTITGPYTFQDIAVNTFSHNSAPIVLPDGSYAIFHVGDGSGPPDGGDVCTATTTSASNTGSELRLDEERNGTQAEYRDFADMFGDPSRAVTDQHRVAAGAIQDSSTAVSNIHISSSLHGPWIPLANNTLGHCNNPSPFIHPTNNSIYIVCNHGQLKRSDSILGPWTDIVYADGAELDNHKGGPQGHYEDPNLYIDHRGHFHVIWHVYRYAENPPHGHECVDSTVSGHSYSPDGLAWYDSPIQPYTTQILLTSGLTVTVATRERPRLLFDSSTGQMTHLLAATCSAPNCPDGPKQGCVDCKYDSWDFTLIVPLSLE